MDKNAVIQPNANNRLTIQVEGEGTIAGVGNADIRTLILMPEIPASMERTCAGSD